MTKSVGDFARQKRGEKKMSHFAVLWYLLSGLLY